MPHSLTLRSAEPVAMRVQSDEMSMQSTGNLWPYNDRKNWNRVGTVSNVCQMQRKLRHKQGNIVTTRWITLRVSTKNTLTVLSSKETARYLPSELNFTAKTSSGICRVLVWTRVSLRLQPKPVHSNKEKFTAKESKLRNISMDYPIEGWSGSVVSSKSQNLTSLSALPETMDLWQINKKPELLKLTQSVRIQTHHWSFPYFIRSHADGPYGVFVGFDRLQKIPTGNVKDLQLACLQQIIKPNRN